MDIIQLDWRCKKWENINYHITSTNHDILEMLMLYLLATQIKIYKEIQLK